MIKLFPQKYGQAHHIEITPGPDVNTEEIGHWYSPDRVEMLIEMARGECALPANAGLERERFEEWVNHTKALERFSGSSAVAGFYVREEIQMQWEAWQAALRSNV